MRSAMRGGSSARKAAGAPQRTSITPKKIARISATDKVPVYNSLSLTLY
jgi:hypothetical protein